jgi:hypothetical protein
VQWQGIPGGVWQSHLVIAAAVERISEFSDRFTRAQATEVIELPWGFAVLQREFPLSHFHNRIIVTAAASAPEILDAADRVLEGLAHRYVTVDDDALGAALGPELEAEGYEHETIATMVHSGAPVAPTGARRARGVTGDAAPGDHSRLADHPVRRHRRTARSAR